MRRLTAILLLTTALAGCASYQVHPGSLNRSDSVFYDALLGAQASIDAAKASQLSVERKAALNEAVRLYNAARASWIAYHHTPGQDPAQLNTDLVRLSNALIALKGAK